MYNSFLNSRTGYVPSEGAAGLILKTRSAATRDGDNILAVVISKDVKHDGRYQGLVALNVKTPNCNADHAPRESQFSSC